MEPLTFPFHHRDEESIECWDDDDDLLCDDVQLRAASTATSVTNSSVRRSGHRDSISSRLSARSDLDSNPGGDEDWQVPLVAGGDIVSEEAITSARNAGIPLPSNISGSALVGGTIRRLGNKKPKKCLIDDWSEDVEFPGPESVLELKSPPKGSFPESIRQVSSPTRSPIKGSNPACWDGYHARSFPVSAPTMPPGDQDDDEDGSQDVPTIKLAKSRCPHTRNLEPRPWDDIPKDTTEDLENDFELPEDFDFRMPHRKVNPQNSTAAPDDLDVDWSEGSIGVRFGGTGRDYRSNPSSSVSVVSPGASSCLTSESDDDGLDGLVIPEGPLSLGTSLNNPREPNTAVVDNASSNTNFQESLKTEDFFSDLEIGDLDPFSPRKFTVNPNVKCKKERTEGSPRRSATTFTFTNPTGSPRTRIPRLSNHERQHSTHLETVSESGAPLAKFGASQFRNDHPYHYSAPRHSSSSTSSSPGPLTPARRLVGTRISRDALVDKSASGGKRLLNTKRSMPTMRNMHHTTSTSSRGHPRQDVTNWSNLYASGSRSPVDRVAIDTKPVGRKLQAPFIPAGASERQSHHASLKTYRHSRRSDSEGSNDIYYPHGPSSRVSRSNLRGSLGGSSSDLSPETVMSSASRTLTRPARRRHFGDGTELSSFDDLPTSTSAESKFMKQPSGRGVPRSFKSKLERSNLAPQTTEAPRQQVQQTQRTPSKSGDFTPRFARDTNASRNAREQRIASMTFNTKNRDSDLSDSFNANFKAQFASRVPPGTKTIRNKKNRPPVGSKSKPQLIKPMGAGVQEPKCKSKHHFRVAIDTDIPSYERHAIQPQYFSLGRKREPSAGIWNNFSQNAKTGASAHN